MSKKYKFDELSDKICTRCGKPLKKRLVEEREPCNIDECYKCHILSEGNRGHVMKKEIKGGDKDRL